MGVCNVTLVGVALGSVKQISPDVVAVVSDKCYLSHPVTYEEFKKIALVWNCYSFLFKS